MVGSTRVLRGGAASPAVTADETTARRLANIGMELAEPAGLVPSQLALYGMAVAAKLA